MFRFVALSWVARDEEGAAFSDGIRQKLLESHQGWVACLEIEGLTVLTGGSREGPNRALPLEGNAGVVLGTVFHRHSRDGGALKHFSASEAARITSSNGQHLVNDYWGRYVALLRPPGTHDTIVLRDPIGALPCFCISHHGVRIFFSALEELASFALPTRTVNWRFVAAYMYQPRLLRCRETGLKGVEEVLPGESWRLDTNGRITKETCWSPPKIARSGRLDTLSTILQQLDETTRQCVSAWASCYPRIVHLLSGGLDSSIVLRCIRYNRDVEVTALNFYNSFASSSDERRYARLAAESASCRLLELEEDPASTDLNVILGARPSVKPWGLQYYQSHSGAERAVTDEVQADAVFSGSGGDHLFFQGPVAFTAADYAHDRGIDSYLIRLCFDIAFIEGHTLLSVLKNALINGYGFRKWKPERHVRPMRLTTEKVRDIAMSSGLLKPAWLEDRSGLAYGKLEHMRICAAPHDFYHPFGWPGAPERVSPLISQPLIELCLQTPTYILAMGGQDRYLAREAFSNVLPEQIVRRRAKGSADAYLQRLLARNLDFARDMLLDGLLVANGYLDRRKLEQALTKEAGAGPLLAEAIEVIAFHLGTEAWLRGVTTASSR